MIEMILLKMSICKSVYLTFRNVFPGRERRMEKRKGKKRENERKQIGQKVTSMNGWYIGLFILLNCTIYSFKFSVSLNVAK